MLLDWVLSHFLCHLCALTQTRHRFTQETLSLGFCGQGSSISFVIMFYSLWEVVFTCAGSAHSTWNLSLHISLAQLDVWHRKMRTLYASLWRSSPVFQLMSLSHGGSSELCLSQTSELWSFGYVFPLNRSSSIEYTEYEQSERIKSRQKSPFSLPNLKRSLCCWQWVSHWLEGHPQRKVIYDLELETESGKQAWITWGSVAGTL